MMIEFIQKQGYSKNSIAKRLAVYILLFSSAITLVGTSLQLFHDYSEDVNFIKKNIHQIETSHLKNIINNLWISDTEYIEIQLNGILALPDMQHINIMKDDKILYSFGNPQSDKVITQQFPLEFPFEDKIIHLGTLHVVASLSGVYQRLYDKVLVILITQSIKTFLVSFFILFLFYYLVGRHLVEMSKYAKTLDLEHLDNPLILNMRKDGQSNLDELSVVSTALNTMRINLKKDIVAREKIEVELRKSEEKFKAMADTSPLAIYMSAGLEQKAEYINPTFINLFGYTHEDVPTAEQWWPLAFPNEKYRQQIKEDWQERVEKAIKDKSEIEPMEVVITCKDGSEKNISWGFINFGKQSWAFGLNLTEQKKADLIIKEYSKKLELMVEERTDKLKHVQSKLLRQEKLAAIGKLSGSVAHDIRNPLGVISNSVYFLNRANKDIKEEKLRKHLRIMEMEVSRANNIISDLMDFSRENIPAFSEGNISNLIRDLLVKFIVPGNITMELDLATNLPLFFFDFSQIQRSFHNLITNAIQAMPEGGKLQISSVEKNDTVVIKIRDTGGGDDL